MQIHCDIFDQSTPEHISSYTGQIVVASMGGLRGQVITSGTEKRVLNQTTEVATQIGDMARAGVPIMLIDNRKVNDRNSANALRGRAYLNNVLTKGYNRNTGEKFKIFDKLDDVHIVHVLIAESEEKAEALRTSDTIKSNTIVTTHQNPNINIGDIVEQQNESEKSLLFFVEPAEGVAISVSQFTAAISKNFVSQSKVQTTLFNAIPSNQDHVNTAAAPLSPESQSLIINSHTQAVTQIREEKVENMLVSLRLASSILKKKQELKEIVNTIPKSATRPKQGILANLSNVFTKEAPHTNVQEASANPDEVAIHEIVTLMMGEFNRVIKLLPKSLDKFTEKLRQITSIDDIEEAIDVIDKYKVSLEKAAAGTVTSKFHAFYKELNLALETTRIIDQINPNTRAGVSIDPNTRAGVSIDPNIWAGVSIGLRLKTEAKNEIQKALIRTKQGSGVYTILPNKEERARMLAKEIAATKAERVIAKEIDNIPPQLPERPTPPQLPGRPTPPPRTKRPTPPPRTERSDRSR